MYTIYVHYVLTRKKEISHKNCKKVNNRRENKKKPESEEQKGEEKTNIKND